MRRSVVIGCAGYLPENIVSNSELAKQLDTSDEWIQRRSGILKRHIAASNELTSDYHHIHKYLVEGQYHHFHLNK